MANIVTDVGYWRDSSRVPKFYGIDGRASFPILLFLLHIKLWTFVVAIVAVIFFSILERHGFRMKIFGRWFRNLIAGNRKMAKPWWF